MADDHKAQFRVFTVVPREGDKPFWLNVGAAFPHKDGSGGFTLQLQALPLDGKLVIRPYDPSAIESDTLGEGETGSEKTRAKK